MKTNDHLQKTAVAAIPATCGELVYGTWQGQPCLVSCPIDRYSTATVTVSKTIQPIQQPQFAKANKALLTGLAWLEEDGYNGRFHIDTTIPRRRGYGSSTADIGAVLYALAQACERPLSATQAAKLTTMIEHTNSSLFPGLAMIDPHTGQHIESFPYSPPLVILIIDPGTVIDISMHHHQNNLAASATTHQITFGLLRTGLLLQDWEMVGKAATLSAIAHQDICFNPFLEKILKLANSVSALGVCRAHSGSILGLLLNPATVNVNEIYKYVQPRLPAPVKTSITTLVDGGPRYGMPFHTDTSQENLDVTNGVSFTYSTAL